MSIYDDIKEQIPLLNTDFENRAADTLVSEYNESERFKGEVKAYATQFNDLRDAFLELFVLRSLDEAAGANLDIIGDIVGQPRTGLPQISDFFGYQRRPPLPQTAVQGYATRTEGGGGRYRRRGDPGDVTTFTDTEYRTIIKAKIQSNYSYATSDDMSEMVLFAIELGNFIFSSFGYFVIYFLGNLTEFKRNLLKYKWTDSEGQKRSFFPHTLGTRLEARETSTTYYFGYLQNPNVKGYYGEGSTKTPGSYAADAFI